MCPRKLRPPQSTGLPCLCHPGHPWQLRLFVRPQPLILALSPLVTDDSRRLAHVEPSRASLLPAQTTHGRPEPPLPVSGPWLSLLALIPDPPACCTVCCMAEQGLSLIASCCLQAMAGHPKMGERGVGRCRGQMLLTSPTRVTQTAEGKCRCTCGHKDTGL